MLHSDKKEFLKVLERTSAQTGFPLRLLEKDYYLTIVLSEISSLCSDLVFKGGTCLSKVYYSYYRLSEDLDFTLRLPDGKTGRTARRNAIRPVKEALKPFLKSFDMSIANLEQGGHRESTQYIYYLDYESIVLNRKESIKLEIGMRFNPLLAAIAKRVTHRFLHPFTKEPLFATGNINCLSLMELVAEKLRAAATRRVIAGRDFYDLGFLLKEGFDFSNKEFIAVFRQKLLEDGFPPDMSQYKTNLGRSKKEIDEMKSRVKDELFPVLTVDEQKSFDMQDVLEKLNKVFEGI
jgi:predicted nucleotidyltransferase component of viral defense system